MAEERLTLRELGFDFGPDPFGDKALAEKISAYFHSPEFAVHLGLLAVCVAYWLWVHLRARAEKRDAVVIGKGREAQVALRWAIARKELVARDPGYDEGAFLRRAEAAFLRVSDAWSRHDLASARAFLSDGMHERLYREIERQRASGVRDYLRETVVRESALLGYGSGRDYDSASVRFKVSAVRARVDAATGKILDGREEVFEEIWTFLRRPTAKTLASPGAIEGFCPSCGAPVSITDAVTCSACKTWINSGEHDWVVVKNTVPWEWRFPDPGREVTGWAAARERDPGLSLESLEDRAAVAFWRRLDARPQGVLLGAAETAAFDSAGDFERAHVQLRWESGGERNTDTMIFRRRAGLVSDRKAGLSATRCPGCGAAPERADAEKCAYCALTLDDGSRGWALSEIVPFGEWKRPQEAAPGVLPGTEWGDDIAPAEAVAALAFCLAADGIVHHRELVYLVAYARRRGLGAEEVEKVVEEARAGRLPYAPLDGAGGSLLRGLIRMSLADGHIEDSERALLAAAARRAGLHELELKAMIQEERTTLAARARELLERLG